jgi:tRNA(fMet)-specific endonuclease VapC
MIRYLLDTDHLTLQEYGHAPLRQRLAAHPPDSLAASIVSAEEILRGRLAVLSRSSKSDARVRAYAKLLQTLQFLNSVNIVPFDQTCEAQLKQLLSLRPRPGTQDLKIAATALAFDLIVVTRNSRDFGMVPGLTIEDWSTP